MPTVSVYRPSIWLPILVPAIVIVVANTLGLRLAAVVVLGYEYVRIARLLRRGLGPRQVT